MRAARSSTGNALADAPRSPPRRGWLIAISAWMPLPLLLALRVAAHRPRRVVLGVVSVAATVNRFHVLLVMVRVYRCTVDGPKLILMGVQGHGSSDKPRGAADFRAELLADDAAAVLDAAEISFLCGPRVLPAGRVAFNLGAHHPNRASPGWWAERHPMDRPSAATQELELAQTLDEGIDAYTHAIAEMLGVDDVPDEVREELRRNDVRALAALARAGADWSSVIKLQRVGDSTPTAG